MFENRLLFLTLNGAAFSENHSRHPSSHLRQPSCHVDSPSPCGRAPWPHHPRPPTASTSHPSISQTNCPDRSVSLPVLLRSPPTYRATPTSNPGPSDTTADYNTPAVAVAAPLLPERSHGGVRLVPPCRRSVLILRGHLLPATPRSSGCRLCSFAVASILLFPPRFPREAPAEPLRSQRRSHDAASGGVQGLYGGRRRPRRP